MWERPEDTGRAPGEVSWAGSTKDSHGAWLQREYQDSEWTAGPDRCRGVSQWFLWSEPDWSPLSPQEGPRARVSLPQLQGSSACVACVPVCPPPTNPPTLPHWKLLLGGPLPTCGLTFSPRDTYF